MRVQDLGGNFSFFSPLTLDAQTSGTFWALAAQVGEWHNPRHGEIPITVDDLASMYRNFSSGLFPPKPQQLPVDYEHLSVKEGRKAGDGVAGAWILDLQLRADGRELWAKLEPTPDGAEHLRKKHYKGFSPMFHPNYTTHGKKTIGPTLLGGAFTNYQTIPSCVLNLSLDPASKGVALASVDDLPYSERERRVREALSQKFPPTLRPGSTEPDYSTITYPRFCFDDRVTFERGDKVFSIKYSFDETLGVTFEGEPYEVVITDTPVVSLSTEQQSMKVIKMKDAGGKDVEIPADALTLDALAEVPAVRDLQARIPKDGQTVDVAAFDTLSNQVKTLSATLDVVKTENTALRASATAAEVKLLDAEITGLIAQGRILPAEKETFTELAATSRPMFDKMIAARKAGEPLIKLSVSHGSDALTGANSGSAVVKFDALVEAEKAANPKASYADSILAAAKKNPDLARQRNIELSLPVGPGGVVMA
jgi:phage I-like protein